MIQYLKGFKEIFIILIKFLFSLLQNNCKYMELIKKNRGNLEMYIYSI